MATNLINLVRRNLDGLSKFPDHMIAEHIPTVLSLKGALLDEFDDNFTRIAGGAPPDFPFATAQDCKLYFFSLQLDNDRSFLFFRL